MCVVFSDTYLTISFFFFLYFWTNYTLNLILINTDILINCRNVMQYYLFIWIHLSHFSWVSNIIVCICQNLYWPCQKTVEVAFKGADHLNSKPYHLLAIKRSRTFLKSSFICHWNIINLATHVSREHYTYLCCWFEAAGM